MSDRPGQFMSLGEIAYSLTAVREWTFSQIPEADRQRWEQAALVVVEQWYQQAIQPVHGQADWGKTLYSAFHACATPDQASRYWGADHGLVQRRYRIAARHVIRAVAQAAITSQQARIDGQEGPESLFAAPSLAYSYN